MLLLVICIFEKREWCPSFRFFIKTGKKTYILNTRFFGEYS
jgi:hypothetical protein